MSANVIITFTVKPEKADSFKAIMNSVKIDLPKVEGCLNVGIYNDQSNTNVYTLVESWESEELHQKHISGVIGSSGWDAISEHLTCDPASSYFSQI